MDVVSTRSELETGKVNVIPEAPQLDIRWVKPGKSLWTGGTTFPREDKMSSSKRCAEICSSQLAHLPSAHEAMGEKMQKLLNGHCRWAAEMPQMVGRESTKTRSMDC